MLNRLTLIFFSIGILVSTHGACAQQDLGTVIELRSCSPESFDHGSCTLSCTVNETSTLTSWSWQYFTTSEYTYITIYDGVQLNRSDYTYTSSLTLDDYNAGTYKCVFSFSNNPSLSAKIKISTAGNGADLNENCAEDHDCNALHATCTYDYYYQKDVCQCSGEYNITYSSWDDTLSCLKLQPEGGHCYSYQECSRPTQSYSCVNSQCTCTGQKTEVGPYGNSTIMCIQPEYLYYTCYYDEQCQLTTEHSYCYDSGYGYGYGYCDCESGYSDATNEKDLYSYTYCYKTITNGWVIAGIVLGCLFGLSLIGTTIYYILKKHNL